MSDGGLKAKGAPMRKAREADAAPGGAGKELRARALPPSGEAARRRLMLVTAMLVVALVLGIGALTTFVLETFPQAGTPGALAGQVIDNETVIEGAVITVVDPPSTNITVTTDAGGNFTLRGLPVGRASFSVAKANYTTTTFTVYLQKAQPSGEPQPFRAQYPIERGTGTKSVDLTVTHDAFAAFCLALLVIGNVLAAAGTMAAVTRRRYRMVVLGGIGAFMANGYFVGALLGIVAALLARGARSQFQDQRGLVAPDDVPKLTDEDDAEEADESEEDGGEGPDGAAEDGGEGGGEDAGEGQPEEAPSAREPQR